MRILGWGKDNMPAKGKSENGPEERHEDQSETTVHTATEIIDRHGDSVTLEKITAKRMESRNEQRPLEYYEAAQEIGLETIGAQEQQEKSESYREQIAAEQAWMTKQEKLISDLSREAISEREAGEVRRAEELSAIIDRLRLESSTHATKRKYLEGLSAALRDGIDLRARERFLSDLIPTGKELLRAQDQKLGSLIHDGAERPQINALLESMESNNQAQQANDRELGYIRTGIWQQQPEERWLPIATNLSVAQDLTHFADANPRGLSGGWGRPGGLEERKRENREANNTTRQPTARVNLLRSLNGEDPKIAYGNSEF